MAIMGFYSIAQVSSEGNTGEVMCAKLPMSSDGIIRLSKLRLIRLTLMST